MKLTEKFLRGWFILSIALLATVAIAEVSRVGANWYLLNEDGGEFTIGTASAKQIKLATDQAGSVTGVTISGTTGDIVPLADGAVDLGTASLEFMDGHFDGVLSTDRLVIDVDIQSDATSLGLDAAAGANTACSTTCAVADGACVLGFDAGTTALVDCASALADTCICTEAVS